MQISLNKNNFIPCGRNRFISLNNVHRIEWSMGIKGHDVQVGYYGRHEEVFFLDDEEFEEFLEALNNEV